MFLEAKSPFFLSFVVAPNFLLPCLDGSQFQLLRYHQTHKFSVPNNSGFVSLTRLTSIVMK